LTTNDLVDRGSLSADAATFLEAAVLGKSNILVSGGTGTGKTTILNILSSYIGRSERVVTVEDAVELNLDLPNLIRLEARPANSEGAGEVSIRDLVRNSLRMRPDRIVVGEVRGQEALDMLQAMNTGHEGSLSTLHANTPRDALRRLETMVLLAGVELPLRAIREQIASAIDLIVQLSRDAEGRRFVSSITEVVGMEGDVVSTADLFVREGEQLVSTGVTSRHFAQSVGGH
jgi:pilus assembly protein CpaF